MRVDFIVPGFSKCGTTTLCFLLNQHPDIFLPLREADFFGTPGYAEHWDVYAAAVPEFFNIEIPGVKQLLSILELLPFQKFHLHGPLDNPEANIQAY